MIDHALIEPLISAPRKKNHAETVRDARAEIVRRVRVLCASIEQSASFLDDDSRERVITFISEAALFIVFQAANSSTARLGCKKGLARMGHQGLKRE